MGRGLWGAGVEFGFLASLKLCCPVWPVTSDAGRVGPAAGRQQALSRVSRLERGLKDPGGCGQEWWTYEKGGQVKHRLN